MASFIRFSAAILVACLAVSCLGKNFVDAEIKYDHLLDATNNKLAADISLTTLNHVNHEKVIRSKTGLLRISKYIRFLGNC